MKLTLPSPAKINLFLQVTGKRENGYHELCSAMVKLGLGDTMAFDFSAGGIRVSCDHPKVPEDRSNLVCKAGELFFREWEALGKGAPPVPGLAVAIEKKIPVGGGLGGGSSNAATTLMALNRVCGSPFTREKLMEMGLALGADVPFFIFGGPALARGVGEILDPIPPLPPMEVVLVDPGIHSSTVRVFQNFKLTIQEKLTINPRSNVLTSDLGLDEGCGLKNDLEVSAFTVYPGIQAAKERMETLLNTDVHMSGSGSTLFVLYPPGGEAEAAYHHLRQYWKGNPVTVFRTFLQNG